jgi:hypothetical protein
MDYFSKSDNEAGKIRRFMPSGRDFGRQNFLFASARSESLLLLGRELGREHLSHPVILRGSLATLARTSG